MQLSNVRSHAASVTAVAKPPVAFSPTMHPTAPTFAAVHASSPAIVAALIPTVPSLQADKKDLHFPSQVSSGAALVAGSKTLHRPSGQN